jgi:hypothetical protein
VADDLDALVRRGRAHRGAGELDQAIATFTLAHERFPAAAKPLCERGALLGLDDLRLLGAAGATCDGMDAVERLLAVGS